MDNIDWLATIAFAKDILGMITSLALVGVAILGLSTWRKQLKANTANDVGTRLLKAIFLVRDAIQGFRYPFVFDGEINASLKEAGIEISPDSRNYRYIREEAVYNHRWKPLREALLALEAVTFEAEVLWGIDATNAVKSLKQCASELRRSTEKHIQQYDQDNIMNKYMQNAKNYLEELEKINNTVFTQKDELREDTENPFSVSLLRAITDAENFIRPKLIT